jgi:hypothetical protein
MKKYEKVAEVSTPLDDTDAFLNMVSTRIDEYQQDGLQVEVQYQYGLSGKSALILGYKEERNDTILRES